MRDRTGFYIGGLHVQHNPAEKENPITIFVDSDISEIQPMDYEDAENLIKILRAFIREGRKAS